MLEKLKEIWKKYGFEIAAGASVVIVLGLYLFLRNRKGTWSRNSLADNLVFAGIQKTGYDYKKVRNVPKDSKGELECRRVLEKLFNKPFSKARPDFLRNPVTGGSFNLELDCYNPQLRLAVEYSGIQHYKYTPYFHKNREAFLNQRYRDDMKKRLCKEQGVILIEVPYTIKIQDIEGYLISQLERLNIG